MAVYDFGLSHEQFLELTPATFSALSDRYDLSILRADIAPARICSLIANVNRDAKARPQPFTEKDFMPSYGDEEEAKAAPPTEMTPEQIKAAMLAAFPRKSKRNRGG